VATGNGGQVVRLPAVVTLERDDLGEVYVARCLAVEATSHGDTHEQALANLREAPELYFEDSPVPEVVRALERAGFVQVSGKGSHTNAPAA
jgi:predicted RNase H-like HicB family nuclease